MKIEFSEAPRKAPDDEFGPMALLWRLLGVLLHLLGAVSGVDDELRAIRAEVRSLHNRCDPDSLLDLDETAERLAVSRRTVDTLVHAGELSSLKIRRCRRVPRRALQAYIRRRAEEGSAR